jgi:PAS domain S-box-containing protein
MIKILYVDDEAALLDIGKQFLEMSSPDIQVDTVLSAPDALELVHAGGYDAIISDYQMPVIDGIAFLKRLRADGNKIPFILFTGKGREEIIIEALNSGADFYLQKGGNPGVQFRELEHKVREAVRRSRAEKALHENEERLRRAQAIGLTGCWECTWDGGDVQIWASEEGFRLFGIHRKSDGTMPRDQIEDCIVEREMASKALQALIEKGAEYNIEYEITPADGGPHRIIHSMAELVRDADGRPIKAVGVIQDITDRRRTEETLLQKTALLEAQTAASLDGILVVDEDLKRIFVNQRVFDLFNVPPHIRDNEDDRLLLEHVASLTRYPDQFLEKVKDLNEHINVTSHDEIEFKNGMVLERYSAPVLDKDGKYYGRTWTFHDITERRGFSDRLRRLNRELVAIKECGRALVKARTEQELLDSICRIVCEVAGYRMAWIGMAEQDEARSVRPVAWSGFDPGYVAQIKATWGEDDRGRGPTGSSIRTGKVVFVQDFVDDARMAPWRENALKNGYRSCIGVPLLDSDKAIGAFTIYSGQPNGFTDDEVGLLEEMAGDLAFGIVGLRARAKREKAEEAVRRDEARNRALFELAQMSGLTPKDIAERAMDHSIELSRSRIGYIAFLNEDETVLTMQHYSKGAMERCNFEDRPLIFNTESAGLWAEAVRQRKPVLTNDYEAPGPLKKGLPPGHIPLKRHMSIPVFDRGRIVAVAGVGNKDSEYTEQDATDISLLMDGMWRIIRKIQAEEDLVRHHGLLNAIAESIPDAIFVKDLDGNYLMLNPGGARIAGVDAKDALGKDDVFLFGPEVAKVLKEEDRQVIRADEAMYFDPTVLVLGQMLTLRSLKAPLHNTKGEVIGVVGVSRDVTELRRVELALKEGEEKFRNIFNNASDAIMIQGLDGSLLDVNEVACRRMGYTRDELLKLSTADLEVEEYQATVPQRIRDLREKGHSIFETVNRRKDGSLINQEINCNIINYGGRPAILGIARDITERRKAEEAIRVSDARFRALFEANGDTTWVIDQETGRFIDANPAATRMYGYTHEEIVHLDVRDISAEPEKTWGAIHPVQGFVPLRYHKRKDGTVFPAEITANTFVLDGRTIIIGTARDISERLRTEEALRETNRKLNLLSGITRHDITNQLLILNGYLSLIERRGADPVRGEQIYKAKATADRIERMIQFTRTYEDIGLKDPLWHDLWALVASGQSEVQLGSLTVINAVSPRTQVLADPLITKVISNLIDNAKRHGEWVTTVRFSTSERDGDLALVCEDDGCGVPDEEKERIFERGFGKNTGLGLFLSKEVLAITRIAIRECGEPGKGARFEIRVPKGSYRSG